ncbi:hypothetical protein, partial [Aeromonas jandaei]|uniref:hypothetical protein n=1 Tax=Aeromonas jandaei TaxID=650 RepID=UPI00201643E9
VALLGRRRADPIKARAGKRLTDRPDTLTQTTSGNQFKLADKEQTIHFLLVQESTQDLYLRRHSNSHSHLV